MFDPWGLTGTSEPSSSIPDEGGAAKQVKITGSEWPTVSLLSDRLADNLLISLSIERQVALLQKNEKRERVLCAQFQRVARRDTMDDPGVNAQVLKPRRIQ